MMTQVGCVCSFRHQQLSSDTRLSEAHSEVKLRTFECERTQMVHEETVRTLKEAQIEQEKLQKKLEVRLRFKSPLIPICCRVIGVLLDH